MSIFLPSRRGESARQTPQQTRYNGRRKEVLAHFSTSPLMGGEEETQFTTAALPPRRVPFGQKIKLSSLDDILISSSCLIVKRGEGGGRR